MKKEILNNDALTVRVNTHAATDAVEEVVDAVESAAVDVVEHAVPVFKNNPYLIAGVAVAALTVGAVVGYKYAEKKLQTKYDQLLVEDMAEAREFYSRVNANEDKKSETERQQAGEAAQALEQYQGRGPAIESEITDHSADPMFMNPAANGRTEDSVLVNGVTFNGQPVDDEFDYEKEEAQRDPNFPYVVSQLEYFQNENELEQSTLTYYKEDDTLADERDVPIEDIEKTVGSDNLQLFGHGSKDPRIVYVRNERLRMEWEITLSEGSYKEALGLSDEDEIHPANRRVRRGDHG